MVDLTLRLLVRNLDSRLERIEAKLAELIKRPNVVFNMGDESSGEESDASESDGDESGSSLSDVTDAGGEEGQELLPEPRV